MTLNTLQYRLIVDSTLLLSPLSTYTRKLFKSLFLQKTTTTASYANKGLQPTAATLTSTSPSPARKLAPGKEFDGSYLHATIARKCNSCYNYDKNLTKLTCERGRSRSILGHFFCNNCEPPHDWHSSNICTELFLASNDRYRTILHAQQCRRCEAYVEPKVDKENYVKKVVSTLDLWTGRRKRLESTREFEETDLHDRERCHGCQTGVCKEFDGADLHAAVVRGSGHHYKYNQKLSNATSDRKDESRYIVGSFTCARCTRPRTGNRTWHSGVICTQVFFTSDDRYRTILHAQQCRRCQAFVKPEVDEDNYVKKIVSALDLWSGRRERLESTWEFKETDPHDEERCHGCQIGVCKGQRRTMKREE
ncbi:MAG: hypothetical protein JOS17DRAFT_821886 [Linnemannia elongata]|nr:MAG: hypothetical protein JOS17DRAFT_821886 [Linnemannia elongata]